MRIASIVGSLRQGSWNHTLSDLAIASLRDKGAEVVEVSLADLPLFNGDRDTGQYPESVEVFRSALHSADGLIIAAPEFNHSIPALLKNAIEWACRPPNALTDKVAFAMGATPGKSGGIRMHLHLSDCLQSEGCWLIPRPFVLAPNAESVFDADGQLLDPALAAYLDEGMAKLVDTIGKLRGASN